MTWPRQTPGRIGGWADRRFAVVSTGRGFTARRVRWRRRPQVSGALRKCADESALKMVQAFVEQPVIPFQITTRSRSIAPGDWGRGFRGCKRVSQAEVD
jgi:hypothetical protein